jgi:hypothetical protein
MGLSASGHECDYRCEKATQYQISPTASLSDNNATIGLFLIIALWAQRVVHIGPCSFRRQSLEAIMAHYLTGTWTLSEEPLSDSSKLRMRARRKY